ncbi:MAG: SAM-dependent methyltransferase [Dysosmobacter sp.]
MRAMELPLRLRLIAGWVPEGAYLADVGTDHGYLPTWLRLQGKSGEQWPAICGPARWTGQGDRIALRYGQH